MTQISDKTKQQFLALYLGQPCLATVDDLPIQGKLVIDADLLSTQGLIHFTEVSACLKRLEDMSSQDVVELYNLKQNIVQYQDKTYFKAFTYHNGVFQIEVENSFYNSYLMKDVVFHVSDLSYKYIDFLRSKGYCLPYLNSSIEDLIEQKWITFFK